MRPSQDIGPSLVAESILATLNTQGTSRNWHVSRPLYLRKPSEKHAPVYIFKAREIGQPSSVCVKIFLSPVRPLEEAVQEFRALQTRYNASKANGGFRVPQPIAFVEGQNAIVMEWIEGAKLQELLMWQALSRVHQSDCLHAAGNWLRAMHASSPITYQIFDYGDLANNVNRRIAALSDGERFSRSRLASYARFFVGIAEQLDRSPVPHTILHDDFAPRNLISVSNEIAAIDISTLHRGPVCRDHAEFMLYYDLYDPVGIATRTIGVSSGRLSAFFQSYDPTWTACIPDWVLYRYMFAVLSIWITVAEWQTAAAWRKLASLVPYDRFSVMAGCCAEILSRRSDRPIRKA
jgi:hypothetical protein